jgi:hypothetical protein
VDDGKKAVRNDPVEIAEKSAVGAAGTWFGRWAELKDRPSTTPPDRLRPVRRAFEAVCPGIRVLDSHSSELR